MLRQRTAGHSPAPPLAAGAACIPAAGSDGRWHARVTIGPGLDGRPIRKHLSRATKSELERAVRDLERSRDAGTTTWTSSDSTLQQWLEHWLEAILPSTVRWKTLSTYRSQVRVHVIPILGAARLSELRPETLEGLCRRLLDAGSSAHVGIATQFTPTTFSWLSMPKPRCRVAVSSCQRASEVVSVLAAFFSRGTRRTSR